MGLRIPEVFSLATQQLYYQLQLFYTSCFPLHQQGHCIIELMSCEIGLTDNGLPTSSMFFAFSVFQ